MKLQVNCRYTNKDGVQVAQGQHKLSYGTASQQAKQLLEDMGYESKNYGESSAKRTGVTKEYPLPDSTGRKLENIIHIIDVSEEFGKM